jgi:hypothetical protein
MQLHQLSDKIGGTIRLKRKHNPPPPSPVQCCETIKLLILAEVILCSTVLSKLSQQIKQHWNRGVIYMKKAHMKSLSIRSFLIISISSVGPTLEQTFEWFMYYLKHA